MMDSALDAINHVRKSRGLDPLPDPTVIQDNPEGHVDPPPLDFSDESLGIQESEYVDNEADIPAQPEPASPLVRLGLAQDKQPDIPAPTAEAPMPVLFVNDRIGAYRGRAVELSDQDQARIARILLEAAERALRSELAKVRHEAPRRVRKTVEPAAPPQPEKRKRGRPRKAKPDA